MMIIKMKTTTKGKLKTFYHTASGEFWCMFSRNLKQNLLYFDFAIYVENYPWEKQGSLVATQINM